MGSDYTADFLKNTQKNEEAVLDASLQPTSFIQ